MEPIAEKNLQRTGYVFQPMSLQGKAGRTYTGERLSDERARSLPRLELRREL
jgi:hypothetical protein